MQLFVLTCFIQKKFSKSKISIKNIKQQNINIKQISNYLLEYGNNGRLGSSLLAFHYSLSVLPGGHSSIIPRQC